MLGYDGLGILKVKRVGDEDRSTYTQAHLAECFVIQRVAGGAWVFGRDGGGM